MILDTNILVLLEREQRRGTEGKVSTYLKTHHQTKFCITPTIAGEVSAGDSMKQYHIWLKHISVFELLPITKETMWQYGEIYRSLRDRGKLIGMNDLWIAAAAVTHNMPLLTYNLKEFGRIPQLTCYSPEQ